MTPQEHLTHAMKQLQMAAHAREDFSPKFVALRDGHPVAIASNVAPNDFNRVGPAMAGGFGAQALICVIDSYIWRVPEGDEAQDISAHSPSEAFNLGLPGASEALCLQYLDGTSTTFLEQPYKRNGRRITYDSANLTNWTDHGLSGRCVIDSEVLRGAIEAGQQMRATVGELTEAECDVLFATKFAEALDATMSNVVLVTFIECADKAEMKAMEEALKARGVKYMHPDRYKDDARWN